jgi:hypothetical protein
MLYAAELEFAATPAPVDIVAGVRAELNRITDRAVLLESYRRESLGRLATSFDHADYESVALDLAYALRWLELNEGGDSEDPMLEWIGDLADE